MKVDDINFKFFHINKWDNGEFKGDAISTTSELVKISSDGNLGLEEGQKFERGGIYRFTVDVTKRQYQGCVDSGESREGRFTCTGYFLW